VLRDAVIRVELRERPPREEVVLVGGVHEPVSERGAVARLPPLDRCDVSRGFGRGVGPHLRLPVVRAHAERHHTERRERREAVEHAEQRVVEHRAVVDPRAHDDLPVNLDAGVEQQREPAEAGGAAPVAQQAGADVRVGGVDADVQRTEPLGDHPLQIGLGEAREGCEVSVEERQAIVVVLQVEALPHPFGKLIDEAERAMVVTRAHAIEHRARELESQGGAVGLVDHDESLEPSPPQFQLHTRAVGVQLVRDDVAEVVTVDRDDLVARVDARVGSR
jgi:hypothetical protein